MIIIFQETINFATKQIFCASNLDLIPTSFFWFYQDDSLHRNFPMSQKVGLLENSYRKRALVVQRIGQNEIQPNPNLCGTFKVRFEKPNHCRIFEFQVRQFLPEIRPSVRPNPRGFCWRKSKVVLFRNTLNVTGSGQFLKVWHAETTLMTKGHKNPHIMPFKGNYIRTTRRPTIFTIIRICRAFLNCNVARGESTADSIFTSWAIAPKL